MDNVLPNFMNGKITTILTMLVVLIMTVSGFLVLWNTSAPVGGSATSSSGLSSSLVSSDVPGGTVTAVALADDSAGNVFVLWSNGQVYEHPNLAGSNWVYLGNSSAFGSYHNQSATLGNAVGIRASITWQAPDGASTGLVMVLFSNGYASMLEYGVNPHVWQLSKLPGGNSFVALSNDLNSYTYSGAGSQVFYATENNGITYAYSDAFYSWVETINTTVSHNIVATSMWLCNGGSSIGDLRYFAISHSGYTYFSGLGKDYTTTTAWTAETQIAATSPDFVGMTMTPNPYSAYYYYAIEGGANSTIYASGALNGTGDSFSAIGPTNTTTTQVAIQNNFFGVSIRANELILESNGHIVQSDNLGVSFSNYYSVPTTPPPVHQINVMPWICQFCTSGVNKALAQLNATYHDYTMVSYEFFQLQSDQKITAYFNGAYNTAGNPNNITPYVQKLGLGAVPMIISASAGDIYNFTSNPSAVSAAIQQMTNLALINNYTGYDIDWEPSSANTSTAAYYTSFLNQFSLHLDKFGKSLFVEVANWDPTFWNYTNLGNTNITSVNVMDYSGLYSGSGSFLADLQQAVSEIPAGKLSVSLENLNPNNNVNFTALQMEQRFAALEQYGIKFLGLWVLPVTGSLISQIQDFELNYSATTYMNTFAPGSAGLMVTNNGTGNVTFSYQSGSYLCGAAYTSTNFALGTSISAVKYTFAGTHAVALYEQDSTGWHFVSNLTSGTNTLTLPSSAQNVEFAFGNFTGTSAASSYTSYVNYTLTSTKIVEYSWLQISYQSMYTLKINGLTVPSADITSFGPWSTALVPVIPGTYNVTVEYFGFIGYFDNVTATAGNVYVVFSQLEALPGTIHGYISPGTATVTVNNLPVSLSSGQFTYSGAPGSYTIVVSSQFYTTVTEIVAINPDLTTTVYVNLSYSTLAPVVQYTPLNISSTEYSLAWSALYGTDFVNYSIYISTSSGSLGHFVASITSVSDTTYNLTGLSPGTTYYVTIVVNAEGQHVSSNVESFTTPLHTSTSSFPTMDIVYIVIGVIIAVVVIAAVLMALRPKKPTKPTS